MRINGIIRLLCLVVFCFFSAIVFGHEPVNFAGIVRDSQTGRGVAEASVLITGTGRGAATDAGGRFEIRGLPSGQYEVRVTHIGYEDFTKSAVSIPEGEKFFLSITVRPAVVQLSPVTVSTSADAGSHRSSVTIICGRELKLGGISDVADALKQVPGIIVYEEGGPGGRKTVSIRGCRPDQVVVEVDDIPINSASGGAVDLSQFPTDRIEQIEVVRGGESASAGSGALGGIIRIITHKPDPTQKAPVLKTTASGGSFGYGEGTVQVRFPWSPPSFEIYMRHSRSEGDITYEERGVGKERVNNRSERWLGQLTGMWQLHENWQWQSLVSVDTRERGSPGLILQAPTPEATLDERPVRVSSRLTWQRLHHQVALSSYYNFQKREYRSPREQYDPNEDATYYHAPVWTEDEDQQWGGSLLGSISDLRNWGPTHRLSMGVHFRRDDYQGKDRLDNGTISNRSLGHVQRNTVSTCGKADFRFFKERAPLRWTAEGRIDAVRQSELAVETHATGRLRVSFAPLEDRASRWNFIFSGSYGSSYRLPSFVSLFLVESEFALGNKELKPERGHDGDIGFLLGLNREEHAWLQSLKCSVTAFWSRIEDIIIWRSNFRGQYFPDNVAAGEIKGLELSGRISLFASNLILNGYTTFQRARNRTPNSHFMDKVLPLQPEAQGGASIEWFPGPFEVIVSYRSMGRRYTTEDNADPLSTAGRDLEAFSVFDAAIGWRKSFAWGEIKLQGRMKNLLDEDYMIIERSPMPGHSYELQLSIEK